MNVPRAWRRISADRCCAYVIRRFPPHTHALAAVLAFYVSDLLYARLGRTPAATITAAGLAGALTSCILFLLIRVADDWEDLDSDRAVGSAAATSHADLRRSDLAVVAVTAVAIAALLNLHRPASSAVMIGFVGLLALERLASGASQRPGRAVAAITEEALPAVALLFAYAFHCDSWAPLRAPGWVLLVIAVLWTPLQAWKIARKLVPTRAQVPGEQMPYGLSPACGARLASALLLASAGFNALLAMRMDLSLPFLVASTALPAGLAAIVGRSTAGPRAKRPDPGTMVRLYILVLELGLLGHLWLGASGLTEARRGVGTM